MVALVNPFTAIDRDPYWSSVVLLCHFDGADGSTSIIDSSPSGHVQTVSGLALTTSVFKFGTASLQGSGGSGEVVFTYVNPDWDFGTGQFTIECWGRRTAPIVGARTLVAHWPSGTGVHGWKFGFIDTTFGFNYSTTGSDSVFVGDVYTSTLNDFDFFAVDRDGSGVIRVYAGTPSGVSIVASGTYAGTIHSTTTPLTILNDGTNTTGFAGQLDELRITKGVARYSGTCSPPIAAFPNS